MFTRPHRLIPLLAAVAVVAACGGSGDAPGDTRQIDLAPTKAAEPQLADAPVPDSTPARAPARKQEARREPTPPPPAQKAAEPDQRLAEVPLPAPVAVASTPAPTPAPPPAPTTGVVSPGTSITVRPAMRVCTNTHRVGDRFTATLTSPVIGTNGATIPEGAIAVLRIVEANATSRDSVRMAFDIISVRVGDQTYEVVAHVSQSAPMDRINTQSNADRAKKIGAGAAIGAIAGRVLGGNTKSTVIGGAVGAAAGAAAAAAANSYEGCIRDGGTITVTLDQPLVVRLGPLT